MRRVRRARATYRARAFTGALAEPGDPQATGSAILELVDADEPPLRVFFGTGTLEMIKAEYEQRIENWERWDHIAVAAQGGVTTLMSTFGFETTALEVVEGVDLSGKRAIVTGGASGIGVETVRALAKAGAEVTIAARDVDAGEQVATETGATERRATSTWPSSSPSRPSSRGWDGPLHILVNNAGVMAIQELTLNAAGLELQFATNHVGHFALAHGLHGALAAEGARIV